MSNYKNHIPETETLAVFVIASSIFLFRLIFGMAELGVFNIVFGIIGFTIGLIYLLLSYSYRLTKKYVFCLRICIGIYMVAFLIELSIEMIASVKNLNIVSILFLAFGCYLVIRGIIILIKGIIAMLKDK